MRAQTKTVQKGQACAVLRAVCPAGTQKELLEQGATYGCEVCPQFTSFHGEHFGRGTGIDFELRKVLEGSFTRPGAKEALAEFSGCEPHAAKFGGTVLMEKFGTDYHRVRYFEGLVGMLRTWRLKNGRDLVLTKSEFGGQGILISWLSTWRIPPEGQAKEHSLLRITDTSDNYCGPERVQVGAITRLEFPDLNGDGTADLRVMVRSGSVAVPQKFRSDCEQKFTPPEVPTYKLDFLFDGSGFHIAAASTAAFQQVSSDRP